MVKGYPNKGRNGHFLYTEDKLAIVESSPHKDAAWSFVRTILNKDWQLDNAGLFYLPTNKAAYDAVIQKVLDEGMLDTPPGYFSQEDMDMIAQVIDSLPDGARFDNDLYDIIYEEAADYFSGLQSAEDTARIIQSRAGIYVAERSE